MWTSKLIPARSILSTIMAGWSTLLQFKFAICTAWSLSGFLYDRQHATNRWIFDNFYSFECGKWFSPWCGSVFPVFFPPNPIYIWHLMLCNLKFWVITFDRAANKPGEFGEVLSPVSVSYASKEIVDSPEPFSSVTVFSEGEWNTNKEPYEDGLTYSDSGLLSIPETVSKSPIMPQYSDEGNFYFLWTLVTY